ncbi:hypothetical protein [Cohnella silvisoli]|uniref:Uncharacterized protein n=1 Tax=Cohnella silvisoli TaxID=2873699 RepID=A0ABV1L0R0_9BACL|nr:hypothetical protein [Cohnella silvisoli]MCD9025069.1 hypothetical protein [Cohnella silvisoli]
MDLEKIRKTLACSDCPGSEIKIAHSFNEVGIYSRTPMKRPERTDYRHLRDRILFVCGKCGWILREYADDPGKLK